MRPQGNRAERWGPTLLVASAFVVYFIMSRPASAPAGWGSDFDSALREALDTRKSVVVAFYSEGCPPCAAMDRSVLGTDAVRRGLSGFVPVRVNVALRPELARRYQVFATPTYAVVDAVGRLTARTEGYIAVEEFTAFLERASAASRGPISTAEPRPTGP